MNPALNLSRLALLTSVLRAGCQTQHVDPAQHRPHLRDLRADLVVAQ